MKSSPNKLVRLPVGCGGSGFTLMEILVVIIILGVLAGLATPNYQKTIRKARTSEAVTNLKTLHMGQKIYKVDNGSYYGPATGATALANINTNLSVELQEEFYTVTIEAKNGGTTYCAKAVEKNQNPATVYYVDQTGVTTTTKPTASGCP